MKNTTKLLIALIVSIILLIIFLTIAGLVPALRNAYNNLAIIDIPICILTFVIWVLLVFWDED